MYDHKLMAEFCKQYQQLVDSCWCQVTFKLNHFNDYSLLLKYIEMKRAMKGDFLWQTLAFFICCKGL